MLTTPRNARRNPFAVMAICGAFACWMAALEPTTAAEETYQARDTLDVAPVAGEQAEMLQQLRWQPGTFSVTVQPAEKPGEPATVRFPSPVVTGDDVLDRVAMIWYQPTTAHTDAGPLPAIVVVHESGSAMRVGQLFARAFAAKGAHAFLVQLPHYGLRKKPGERADGQRFLMTMRQGIADVRRAYDAVAVLPGVDPERIVLQGTSLGGFVCATVAGVDQAYRGVYIMLAGGDLHGLLQNGEKEAAQLRQRLADAGYDGERLQTLLYRLEPTRLGSRMAADRIWLYSAEQDRVVPLANALALKQAANIPDAQHIRLWGDHTSTAILLPVIVQHVIDHLPKSSREASSTPSSSPEKSPEKSPGQ